MARSNQFKQYPLRHGTRSMYVLGCKCYSCKDANTIYFIHRRRKLGMKDRFKPRIGSLYG